MNATIQSLPYIRPVFVALIVGALVIAAVLGWGGGPSDGDSNGGFGV